MRALCLAAIAGACASSPPPPFQPIANASPPLPAPQHASAAACAQLFDHLLDLELAHVPPDRVAGARASLQQRHADFVRYCTQERAAQIACAIAAPDIEAVDACDRSTLDAGDHANAPRR